jgi:IS30 family transposase
MVRPVFSSRMRLDVQELMWGVWCSGGTLAEAALAGGMCRRTVQSRISEAGGVRPRRRQTRARLSYQDRVYIEVGLKQNRSKRQIALDLGRAPSTVCYEVNHHLDGQGQYSANAAHAAAFEDARRPQESKIDLSPALRDRVVADLRGDVKCSPEQIAGRLRREFPDDPAMNVHHETIYRWIYLQPRGELKQEVVKALRSGRSQRLPRAQTRAAGRGQIPGRVSIWERPAVDQPDGTRIPGHWEGDLIIGKANASAIGTLVERATGYLMLLHLPDGRGVDHVTTALTERLCELPDHLRASLTWDQGKELSHHAKVSIDTGIDIYFADPHSPWHRPSNENTNGLLRQYFPKGTDLSLHTAADLTRVENALNHRPRKRLDYARPQELMTQLLLGS